MLDYCNKAVKNAEGSRCADLIRLDKKWSDGKLESEQEYEGIPKV